MEKLATPLNIITNFIRQNYVPKFNSIIWESNIWAQEKAQEINQIDVVIHTVEECHKVRDKYSFKIFNQNELAHLDSKS